MTIGLRMLAVDEVGTAADGGMVPAWLPWVLVGVGGLVLAGVVLALLQGRAVRRTGSGRHAQGELADLENRLIEVKKLAATVADDLDRRAQRLERLIAQADELLEREGDAAGPARPMSQSRGVPRPPLGSATAVDDLAQRVFDLADRGQSALQIAQALRQPVGNVELMLALRGDR